MVSKKNVGVVTFFAYNYGAFLQAYALQKVMEDMGFNCELIDYDYMRDRTLLGLPWSNIKRPIRFCASVSKRLLQLRVTKKRTGIMAQSVHRNLKLSEKRYGSAQQLREFPPQYDIYLVGSDQVWNPTINTQGFLTRLLDFADCAQGKLVSYAASVGLNKFPERKVAQMKEHLERFDAISVREEEARSILSAFVDKDLERHVDPSLLRTKEEWMKFGKRAPGTEEPYIFVYMLANQPELVQSANRLSRDLGLPIVSVGNGRAFQNRILKDYILSPEEFVGSIANAAYVVSNSFHGTCFSVLFKKKARIFIPPSVQCRITELISGCKLQRLLEDQFILDEDIEKIYLESDGYLRTERDRAYGYLRTLQHL